VEYGSKVLTSSVVVCCCVSYPASDVMKDEWLFSADVIGQALSSSGHDISRLSAPFAGRPSALGSRLFVYIFDFGAPRRLWDCNSRACSVSSSEVIKVIAN